MKEKKLTHHEIIACIAAQTESVIIQVNKESKLRMNPNLRSLIYIYIHISHLLIRLNSLINVL